MPMVQHAMDLLRGELGVVIGSTATRLVLAALLGSAIGLERQLRHKAAGLRTNIFICFGSAMFTVMSDQLAHSFGGDHTRIAAQIILGIGFIGAGSILHSRGSVTGLTTAATIFVTAAVGMAAGGGYYVTAVYATGVILIALAALGQVEAHSLLKPIGMTYEVTGHTTDAILGEINRILDDQQLNLREVRAVSSEHLSRVVFDVECSRRQHESLNIGLHKSTVLATVSALGSLDRE